MLRQFIIACMLIVGFAVPSAAEDRLLTDAVEFTGAVLFLGHDVPGLVIGAVRNGETTVAVSASDGRTAAHPAAIRQCGSGRSPKCSPP